MKILLSILISVTCLAQDFEQPTFVDPFSGKSFTELQVSDHYYFRRLHNEYYYRYITLYNIYSEEKEIHEIPRILEECFEFGNRFAVWSIEKEIQRNIQSSFSFNILGIDLGVGGEISRNFVFSFERWIQAELNIQAIHIPIMHYEVHAGITYQQRYYPANGQTKNIRLKNERFYVDMLNPMFVARRKIIETCKSENI